MKSRMRINLKQKPTSKPEQHSQPQIKEEYVEELVEDEISPEVLVKEKFYDEYDTSNEDNIVPQME